MRRGGRCGGGDIRIPGEIELAGTCNVPHVQLHVLDQCGHALARRVVANFVHGVGARSAFDVLDAKDGFSAINEWPQEIAFLILHALLVDGKIDIRDHLLDNLAAVLQSDGKATLVALG